MTPALYGTWAALIPPVVAIVLALITKEVYSALFLGIVIGALLYSGGNPIGAIEHFFNILHEEVSGNLGILIFLIILGTIVALMIRAGGSKAYGDWASRSIKSKSGALIATGLLGIVLGVDDYFNNLTVGNVMRPVTDTHKISRAKLAYMCDAVAAPVCIMMPISSWAAAVSGIIDGYDGFTLFVQAIPYNFYAILTLIMVFLTAALNINFGPMKKHEDNAAKGDIYTTPERPYENVAEMKFNPNGKVIDLVLPVIILIVGCVLGLIYTGEFFGGEVSLQEAFANCDAPRGLSMGSFVSLIIIMIYFLIRKAFSFNEMMECLPNGFKLMVPATLILTFAWTISGVTGSLGAAPFVAGVVESFGAGLQNFLPAVIFIIACLLAFATGSSWGTFGILIPIVTEVFPPVNGLPSPILMMAIGACLGGAVMGDHCSPISDTTIMASTGAQCHHINHVATQMPYAVVVAAVCFASYILAAFLPNVIIALPIAIILMVGTLLIIGYLNGSLGKKKANV
ncbi:MAG: Na+/H+ antiporter NhaC family protein [Ruminococcaceae bacterium]|nr:Na+/H+ antiporter NhaC family protein [Oscillospiraceae bacterium]